MSRLDKIIVPLKRDVLSTIGETVYQKARIRHPILRRYESVNDVLEALGKESRQGRAAKDMLTRAFIAEYKRRISKFWSSILIVAYAPMLKRLRMRIYGNAMGSDDLDQLVITSFLAVADKHVLGKKRTALLLRQNTQRHVFASLRKRQKEMKERKQLVELAKRLDGQNPLDDMRSKTSTPSPSALARLILKVSHAVIPRDRVEVVIATHLHDQPLKDYVARVFPSHGKEDAVRCYQRVKRQRLRTLARLRELLEDYCCPLLGRHELYLGNDTDTEDATALPETDYWTEEVFQ